MQDSCPHFNSNYYDSSVQGKWIYKDQCTKCFIEPTNEKGVDLCLKCFQSGCIENNHNEIHQKLNSNHTLFLNIRMKEKINSEMQQQKITKLAIGTEGGAQNQNQKEYETFTELKCLLCKITLKQDNIQGLISSILQADSSFKKQNVAAWELDIQPCEHTLTIQQSPPFEISSEKLAHCFQCDLSSNLWLCLTCGNLGCGRAQYDGSGGKGHAKDHSMSTKHPLGVKLGTISAEGSGSVYCYDCNDDVVDNYLASHLANFGIRTEGRQKTEKTMTEMNLEINLNFELSKAVEEGRQLQQVFGGGFTGIQNIGNSCYINSVLQPLIEIDEIKKKYYQQGQNHLNECTRMTSDCFICQFAKLIHGVLSGKFSQPQEHIIRKEDETVEIEKYQEGIKIYQFKNLVGKGHPEFSTNKQQDSLEYLQYLLSYMQKTEKQFNYGKTHSIFEFKLGNKLKCQGCGGVKLRENITNEFKLQCPYIKQEKAEDEYQVDLIDMLKNSKSYGIIESKCPNCKKSSQFSSETYFKTFPKYLILPITRFVLDNWVPTKVQAYIKMDQDDYLDLSNYRYKQSQEEWLLPEENNQEDIYQKVDQQMLTELTTSFGFGRNRAIRGLLENNNNMEATVNWLFEKSEDFTLDQPIEINQSNQTQQNQQLVQQIIEMGFNEKQANKALQKCDQNLERALDFLFSHMGEDDEQDQQNEIDQIQEDDIQIDSHKYQLQSVIVHLGKSVHAGHYICYVKKNGKWIYYNDNKVAISNDPALGKAYILILKQVQ